MSKISELGPKFENLLKMLLDYDKELDNAESQLKITGKRLEMANSENSAFLHFYDARRVELRTLVKFFEMEELRVRSSLYSNYKTKSSIALSEREINRYVDNEDKYVHIHSLLLEVQEMYELYQTVVNAFTSRNYTLNNITKIRVASLEDVEI